MSLESTLFNLLQHYPDTHIIIAYSGGVDSQVLLHALLNLKNPKTDPNIQLLNTMSVCHVNHGLSDNAFKWEAFAQQQCDLRNVSLDICRVNVQKTAQHSLEELARNARYNAIKSLVAKQKHLKSIIITGHHSDDQAETFFLALKRGSGLKGLSSMKPVLPLTDNALLVRPLLNVSRNQIETYAKINELNWIEDESNEDIRFDRNFLRHNVLPIITQRWPSFLNTVNRSAEHCQEAEQLLAELAEQDLENINLSDTQSVNKLSLTKLTALSKARFNNVIRYFLQSHQCLMPSSAQLAQLYSQLLAGDDKTPAVKVGTYWLRRFQQCVYLTHDLNDVTDFEQTVDLQADTETNITLPDALGKVVFTSSNSSKELFENVKTLYIKHPTLTQKVTVSFTHNNPKCIPDYRQHSRVLKKVLQELNIPTWERKRVPFLYYDDQLVAVIGYFVCKDFMPEENDNYIAAYWLSK